jgi:hypothetical protein
MRSIKAIIWRVRSMRVPNIKNIGELDHGLMDRFLISGIYRTIADFPSSDF